MASSEPFDPFTQSFTLLLQDGTPFNVSLLDVDDFVLYSVQICINYASQLGACSILLLALLLLTKPDKRHSPVFILNSLALLLNVIRNVLQCVYFTSPFVETYAHFGQDFSRVPRSAFATSIATTVLAVLLLICIEVSLILQVRVVCFLVTGVYRQVVFAISAVTALLAVAFRLALCIKNSQLILSMEPPTSLHWLESATNITTSISICWFCAVFVTKLGVALHERKQLGLKRFGPMQIIFIMGCQTLIVPAIFSLLHYCIIIPSLESNTLTVVVLFLPLSSLWASNSLSARGPDPDHFDTLAKRRRKLFGHFPLGSGGFGSANEKMLDNRSSILGTVTSKESTIPSPVKASHGFRFHDREASDVTFRGSPESV